MSWANFLYFMMIPAGGLVLGYWGMWLSHREAMRFDEKRRHFRSRV